VKLEPAIRRSVCPEPPAGLLSPMRRPDGFFGTGTRDRGTYGSGSLHPRGVLSWLIERRSVDGVRRPATVGFLLVAAGLAACHFVDRLAEAGCLAGRPGDWMRPSLVRVSADPGDRPTWGMTPCRMPL
jgi:hypothetical protein